MKPYLPRFHVPFHMMNALQGAVNGEDRVDAVRAQLTKADDEGWVPPALDLRVVAAGLLSDEPATTFLAKPVKYEASAAGRGTSN